MTRNVAVCDELGRCLKTYAITIEKREKAPTDAEYAAAALARAKRDKLVPAEQVELLRARVPAKGLI
jgi:hypothetical protein